MADRKTVLVVGGGFAGLNVVQELHGMPYNVILVDPKTYFDYILTTPHSFVSPQDAGKMLVDYPASIQRKQGLLVSMTSDGQRGSATLQGGETLAFDYAFLCTGSSYPAGVKPDDTQLHDRAARLKTITDVNAKITAAKTVVVVGGGSVGVEIASEVAETYPDKKVTLVCAGGVLDRMDPKASQYASAWLEKRGVEILREERITDWGGVTDGTPTAATLAAASGRHISGDLVFKCVGIKPATSFYADSLGAERVAANGSVLVEPTLQVKGWRNVFSVGDCNSVKEEKTANLAGIAAVVAARNMVRLDGGQELQTYPEGVFGGHSQLPMCGGTSLGAREAVFQMGSSLQMGATPAKLRDLIGWLTVRIAAGSRFWRFVYMMMKKGVVSGLTKEAAKAAKVGNNSTAAAPPVGAPAPAAA